MKLETQKTRLMMTAFTVSVMFILGACAKLPNPEITAENLVTVADSAGVTTIGEAGQNFAVYRKDRLDEEAARGNIRLLPSKPALETLKRLSRKFAEDSGASSPEPVDEVTPEPNEEERPEASLLLGFPINLVGESQVFGGVITKVSDKTSELYGRLKLTDLTPLHVRTAVASTGEESYALALVGCVSACTEASKPVPLIGIPILGVDEKNQLLIVDLSAIGRGMNLVDILDPGGAYTQLKTKSSKTVAFDYSLSTLVFDVEAAMIPLNVTVPATAPETRFTTRWYLRLASYFDPAFEARVPTAGVGFFETERSARPRIQRFSRSSYPGTRYFIKNVPLAYQAGFKSAFDAWNDTFKKETGRSLLNYQFVNPGDELAKLLVTGDIRYNIVEWDLENLAPYGGLGPSIANQFTGEILSANVLVQGPKIVELYKKWFQISSEAEALREAGQPREAERLLRDFVRETKAKTTPSKRKLKLSLGKSLTFRIPAQMPQYEDPVLQRDDFEPLPTGFSYDTYMEGYFNELVAHELGHNVGLRHNFRGNLYAAEAPAVGNVSYSIMEYLGRGYRHLNRIAKYDVLAIRYGYLGEEPSDRTLFCTDEHVSGVDALGNSAECSRDDASSDPFAYFDKRLERAVNLLIDRDTKLAPVWTVSDMERELGAALTGLGLYAATAKNTGTTWTHFFNGGDKPKNVADVPAYVLLKLKGRLCDKSIETVLANKESDDARQKVLANLKALRAKAEELLTALKFVSAAELQCAREESPLEPVLE